MTKLILKRIALGILTLLLVSALIFGKHSASSRRCGVGNTRTECDS